MQGLPNAPGSDPVETCQSRCSYTKLSLLSLCLWHRKKKQRTNVQKATDTHIIAYTLYISPEEDKLRLSRLSACEKATLRSLVFPLSQWISCKCRNMWSKQQSSHSDMNLQLECQHFRAHIDWVCLYLDLQHVNKHELLGIEKYIMLSQVNLCLSDMLIKKLHSVAIIPIAQRDDSI